MGHLVCSAGASGGLASRRSCHDLARASTRAAAAARSPQPTRRLLWPVRCAHSIAPRALPSSFHTPVVGWAVSAGVALRAVPRGGGGAAPQVGTLQRSRPHCWRCSAATLSQQQWQHRVPPLRVRVLEGAAVPGVVLQPPRRHIAKSEERKGGGRLRVGRQRPARPLEDLAEKVGAGDELEGAALRRPKGGRKLGDTVRAFNAHHCCFPIIARSTRTLGIL
jgi:hypothetical protein